MLSSLTLLLALLGLLPLGQAEPGELQQRVTAAALAQLSHASQKANRWALLNL